MQKKGTGLVAVANSIVDWLEGKIEDINTHEWGRDRFPLFGPKSYGDNKVSVPAGYIEQQRRDRTNDDDEDGSMPEAVTTTARNMKRKSTVIGDDADEGETAAMRPVKKRMRVLHTDDDE